MLSTETRNFLTIVSGLPRSGTSMMMRMLETGGIPVMIDEIREADRDNPRGYYEFEAVKKTKQDASWLEDSAGNAVKMVYRLLYDLPASHDYRVLVMRRNMSEILASQKKMMDRNTNDDGVGDEMMSAMFRSELKKFDDWIAQQPNFTVLDVDYNQMIADPLPQIKRINGFLEYDLDVDAMHRVVEPSLYRNRG